MSGTAAVGPDGKVVAPGDLHAQTVRCIDIIAAALGELGARLADVRRTRVFVTDIGRWQEVARAHREAFGASPPAATLIEVARLIDPDMLVEIEAEAWIRPDASGGDAITLAGAKAFAGGEAPG